VNDICRTQLTAAIHPCVVCHGPSILFEQLNNIIYNKIKHNFASKALRFVSTFFNKEAYLT